jgi:sec-independent protein translocase protein TatC
MAKKKNTEESEMSFLDHLEALRWHLVRSSVAILTGGLLAFIFKDFVFDVVIFGPKNPDFITYRAFCELSKLMGTSGEYCISEMPMQLINTEMGGQFSTHIWVSLITGIIVAFPYIVFEIYRFVRPALYENEAKHANKGILYTSILFLLGVSFGYFVIAPLSVNFLANYSVSKEVGNFINLSSFISTVTMVTVACGVLFELPVFIYFLSKIGLVTPASLKRYRKHSMVGILIAAAIITPPDIVSQIIVAIPLGILYEVGIFISGRVEKKRLAEMKAERQLQKTG